MRIAVTGRQGQVVTSLVEVAQSLPDVEIIPVGRPELDLADLATIAPALEAAAPDLVVSAAAYTAVDKAEDEKDAAFQVNAHAAGEVARVARQQGVPLIHISTDYVYAGNLPGPLTEDTPVAPANVYGASKLAGEQAVLSAHPDAVILRTAWVYSPFGANFVKTMLRLAAKGNGVRVVSDQHGNPTSALDIAAAVLVVSGKLGAGEAAGGIYHFAGTGEATWFDLARRVMELSRDAGGPAVDVDPIPTADYATRAVRPADTRLDTSRFADRFGYVAPPWPDSLQTVVRRLVAGG